MNKTICLFYRHSGSNLTQKNENNKGLELTVKLKIIVNEAINSILATRNKKGFQKFRSGRTTKYYLPKPEVKCMSELFSSVGKNK